MSSSELAKSSGGTNAFGMTLKNATDSKKKANPANIVFQRCATHQRSSAK
jgi:hypothetical protein